MEQQLLQTRTFTFIAPSGYSYTIREENGEDEEILSNQADVQAFKNITKFLAAIVVATDFTENGKLSIEDAFNIPYLDRYCILIQSRIFSLGNILQFSFTWPGDKEPTYYEQDLKEFLFDDYSKPISEDEKELKPDAIPQYPDQELGKTLHYKNYELTLSSGKVVMFDFADGNAERTIALLPTEKRTRNSSLIARNLKLKVGDNFERVQRFNLFSIKDLAEISQAISELEPTTDLTTEIENPTTGEKLRFPIMSAPRFFFLTEA